MELSTMVSDRQNKLTPCCFSASCHCLVSTLDLMFKYKVPKMLDSPYAKFYFNTQTHRYNTHLKYLKIRFIRLRSPSIQLIIPKHYRSLFVHYSYYFCVNNCYFCYFC